MRWSSYYTISSTEPFVVTDASRDMRFRNNPLVTGDPQIRFYAGVPLALTSGVNLGSLCIVDQKPRQLTDNKIRQLRWLGNVAESMLRQRKTSLEVSALSADLRRQSEVIAEQSRALVRQKSVLERATGLARMGAWDRNLVTGEFECSDSMYALHEVDPNSGFKMEFHLGLFVPADRIRLARLMQQPRQTGKPYIFEGRMMTAKGNLRWVRLIFEVDMKGGKEIRRFGMKQDITEEKTLARKVQRLAQCDNLTGLYNRATLLEKLQDVSRAADRSHGPVYLFLFDLDGFKNVNDTNGHAAGDACLRQIARRVRAAVGRRCLVARLGGDEFAVFPHANGAPLSVDHFAQRIQTAVTLPVKWKGRSFNLTSSIGVAIRGEGEDFDPDELIRKADLALYEAKGAGTNCHRIFRPALNAAVNGRFAVLRDLRNALAARQLEFYYQPKVSLAGGAHSGFEALLRWNKPDGSVAAPGAFMAALEDPVLSRDIGEFVIAEALGQAERWMRAGVPFNTIAINLSESQFRDPNLAERLLTDMTIRNLSPGMIEVELTEGVLMSTAASSVLSICKALKAGGVRIAFDDFGTGFASLTHLRDFPVDIIKIDRSFIARLGRGDNATEIVNAIVQLARNLSMSVVAEGVETAAQDEFLRAIGCEIGQGYLYGRPVPADVAIRSLEQPLQILRGAG